MTVSVAIAGLGVTAPIERVRGFLLDPENISVWTESLGVFGSDSADEPGMRADDSLEAALSDTGIVASGSVGPYTGIVPLDLEARSRGGTTIDAAVKLMPTGVSNVVVAVSPELLREALATDLENLAVALSGRGTPERMSGEEDST